MIRSQQPANLDLVFGLLAFLTLVPGGATLAVQLAYGVSHRFEAVMGAGLLGALLGGLLTILIAHQLHAPRATVPLELLRCLLIAPPVATPPCLLVWFVVGALKPHGGWLDQLLVPPHVAATGTVVLFVVLALLIYRLTGGLPARWVVRLSSLEDFAFGVASLFGVLALWQLSLLSVVLGVVSAFSFLRGAARIYASFNLPPEAPSPVDAGPG